MSKIWLDYKGKRHFLPTWMPEEPKMQTKIAVNLDFAGLTACLYLIRLKFLFSVPLRRLRFDEHSIF